MEVNFCKSDKCKLCQHFKQKDYQASKRASYDRINEIIQRGAKAYRSRKLNHVPLEAVDDSDYENWLDNKLSWGKD